MLVSLVADRFLPAPAAAVFALITDGARFPFPGFGPIAAIGDVRLDAPLAVGSTRRVHNTDGTVLTERVTVLDPPHRHAYELSGFVAPFSWLVMRGEAEWSLAETPAGTSVSWHYDFTLTSPLAWPIGAPLLNFFMHGAMERCLAAMATALAAEPAR
jgi:Polyketide cyclase / dehydrase and lipid transport